jgi:hypothetical protein
VRQRTLFFLGVAVVIRRRVVATDVLRLICKFTFLRYQLLQRQN